MTKLRRRFVDNDTAFKKELDRLIQSGDASLSEFSLMRSRDGSINKIESIEEFIYPTEYEYPWKSHTGKIHQPETIKELMHSIEHVVEATEKTTRNVGSMFEARVSSQRDDSFYLEVDSDLVAYNGPSLHGGERNSSASWGIAQPLLDSRLSYVKTYLAPGGGPIIANVFSPRQLSSDSTIRSSKATVLTLTLLKNGEEPPADPDYSFPEDPFARPNQPELGPGEEDPSAPAHSEPPADSVHLSGVSFRLDYVEVERDDYIDLVDRFSTSTDETLWNETLKLIGAKKARVAESSFVLTKPGLIAETRSSLEFIYPTEFETPPRDREATPNRGLEKD